MVIRLVASRKPNPFRTLNQPQYGGIGGGADALAHDCGHPVDVHAEVAVEVVVVAIRTRGPQYEDVSAPGPFKKPRHRLVVFRGPTHQADAARGLEVPVLRSSCVVQRIALRLRHTGTHRPQSQPSNAKYVHDPKVHLFDALCQPKSPKYTSLYLSLIHI